MNQTEALEALCKEQRAVMKQLKELTERKEILNAQILSLLDTDRVETPFYKILKVRQLSIKTSVDDARQLSCTVMREEVNKDAVRMLYRQGMQVPGVVINEHVRVSEKIEQEK